MRAIKWCITLTFTMLITSGCGLANESNVKKIQLPYNNKLVKSNETFVQRIPPKYTSIDVKYTAPNKDWISNYNDNLSPAIKVRLDNEIKIAKSYFRSQKNKTKYGPWGLSPLLSSITSYFLLTKDNDYLNTFVEFFNYLIHVRMDNQKRSSYNGKLLPQWERLDRYNIFTVSEYIDYDIKDKKKIMKDRNWDTLYFSDVNYSGLFLNEVLKFAQVIFENRLENYYHIADKIVEESQKTFASHENEWVAIDSTEGYYIFPNNSPFFLDGVEMPINEAAPFASSVVRLYLLTKDKKYLERAKAIWKHWESSLAKDKFNYITYPYVTGAWYKGWDKENSPSINSPEAKGIKHFENFQKAGLTIEFIILLNYATNDNALKYYLSEFKKVALAVQKMEVRSVVSDYPYGFGFYFPSDSVHYRSVYYYGWISLMHDNENYLESVFRSWAAGMTTMSELLRATLLNKKISSLEFENQKITIKPNTISDKNHTCDIYQDADSIGRISFQHKTPKRNKLYLYVDDSEEKIRLKIHKKKGYFRGKMFIPKGECINISWDGKSKVTYPATDFENEVNIEITSIKN